MAKAKKRKKNRWIYLVLVGIICLCFGSGIKELKTTVDLKNSIEQSNTKLKELKAKQTDLEKKKKNLLDPDYIEYIARGKYLVTKEGEQVFKFPSTKQED